MRGALEDPLTLAISLREREYLAAKYNVIGAQS
jgi:hypothetical protein